MNVMGIILAIFCIGICVALALLAIRRNGNDSRERRVSEHLDVASELPMELRSNSSTTIYTDRSQSEYHLGAERFPSVGCRTDTKRFLVSIIAPWIIGGIAYLFPLIGREFFRAGLRGEWLIALIGIGFYSFGFLCGFVAIGVLIQGIWRLLRRYEYRQSLYGWIVTIVAFLNLSFLSAVIHGK
jgi:hypothetical protein